jgi:IclR family acetate operon transcriptional repressor
MNTTSKKPSDVSRSGQVQSVTRAISILNALAAEENGLTLTELSQTVSLAPSTTHRLLTTLQQERFVRFDDQRSVWLVGLQAFAVGNAFVRSRELIGMVRPFMRRLMEESGETTNLAVEDREEAVYLAQVECREMMRAFAKPGARVPMTSSAVGKAILAGRPDDQVARLLNRVGLQRVTGRSIATPAALKTALATTRAMGFAVDDEEHAVGLRCVASALYDEHGDPIAAVSVSGPAARVTDERIPALGKLVRSVAAEATQALGGVLPAWAQRHRDSA